MPTRFDRGDGRPQPHGEQTRVNPRLLPPENMVGVGHPARNRSISPNRSASPSRRSSKSVSVAVSSTRSPYLNNSDGDGRSYSSSFSDTRSPLSHSKKALALKEARDLARDSVKKQEKGKDVEVEVKKMVIRQRQEIHKKNKMMLEKKHIKLSEKRQTLSQVCRDGQGKGVLGNLLDDKQRKSMSVVKIGIKDALEGIKNSTDLVRDSFTSIKLNWRQYGPTKESPVPLKKLRAIQLNLVHTLLENVRLSETDALYNWFINSRHTAVVTPPPVAPRAAIEHVDDLKQVDLEWMEVMQALEIMRSPVTYYYDQAPSYDGAFRYIVRVFNQQASSLLRERCIRCLGCWRAHLDSWKTYLFHSPRLVYEEDPVTGRRRQLFPYSTPSPVQKKKHHSYHSHSIGKLDNSSLGASVLLHGQASPRIFTPNSTPPSPRPPHDRDDTWVLHQLNHLGYSHYQHEMPGHCSRGSILPEVMISTTDIDQPHTSVDPGLNLPHPLGGEFSNLTWRGFV